MASDEELRLEQGVPTRLECCRCGLTHLVTLKSGDAQLRIRGDGSRTLDGVVIGLLQDDPGTAAAEREMDDDELDELFDWILDLRNKRAQSRAAEPVAEEKGA